MNVNPLIPHAKKYLNWKDWFSGMYVKSIQSATSAVLAFVGTNSAEAFSPTGLPGLGMNWKQTCGAFVSILVIEIIRYINGKPLPDSVEENTP
jgi:hypothetical protein